MVQTRLTRNKNRTSKYHYGPINQVIDGNVQKIKTFEGCPHNCPYCFEPTGKKHFDMPELACDKVMDATQNVLYRDDHKEYLTNLGKTGKEIELVCGVDFRLLDDETAKILKKYKFGMFSKKTSSKWKWSKGVRIAWDWHIDDQYKIKDAVKTLLKSGLKPLQVMVFMIVNWKIPLWECELKLDMLKVWGVRVCDCCFDGGHTNAVPIHWTKKEIDYFRAKSALHNHVVKHGLYPDLKRAKRIKKKHVEVV